MILFILILLKSLFLLQLILVLKGINSNEFAKMLEEREVYVSTKTSCSLENAPSRPVYALTNDENLSKASLRVSVSHLTNERNK